jgi:hypothetical protein
MLDRDDIETFNWKELHGKDVRVLVCEAEGVQISALLENESGEFFIVNVKQIGEKK